MFFFLFPATNTTKYKKIERYLVTLSSLHFTFNLTVFETSICPESWISPFAIFPVISGSSHGWKTRGAGLRDAPKITEIAGNLGCRLFLAANRVNRPFISEMFGWAPIITLDLCAAKFSLPNFFPAPQKKRSFGKKLLAFSKLVFTYGFKMNQLPWFPKASERGASWVRFMDPQSSVTLNILNKFLNH